MGGPSQSSLNTQSGITQQEIGIQQQAVAGSEQDRAARIAAQQPAINLNTALTSGDPAAVMTAIAPQLTGITQSKAANKEQIYEGLGPGAGRDEALLQNQLNAGNQTASLRANAVSSAYDKLANIGSGLGSFSLQELGAGISSGQAASSANQVNISAAEQSKASTLGFLGNLAGAGAKLATGFSSGQGGGQSTYDPFAGAGVSTSAGPAGTVALGGSPSGSWNPFGVN